MNKNTLSKSQPVVHIVDDDEAVRDAISMLLDSVDIANQNYATAQGFLDGLVKQDIPTLLGCVVLDIRMPGMSGLDCQTKLHELDCPLPIIFITGHGDVPMAVEAMKKGALEFIQKPFREQELLDCIQQAIQLNQHTQQATLQDEEIKTKYASLTQREKDVMQRVVAGQANKVIALELNLSQRTVEIHRANMMEKMQVKTLPDLVKLAITLT